MGMRSCLSRLASCGAAREDPGLLRYSPAESQGRAVAGNRGVCHPNPQAEPTQVRASILLNAEREKVVERVCDLLPARHPLEPVGSCCRGELIRRAVRRSRVGMCTFVQFLGVLWQGN